MLFFVLLFMTPSCFTQQPDTAASAGDRIYSYVREIEGRDHNGRRLYIKEKLREFGVAFTTMPFDTVINRYGKMDTLRGENIIVRREGSRNRIIIGAHYDAVPKSPGANDNGSGLAVLLELIRTSANARMKSTVEYCFFDHEEVGLVGSAVYVRQIDTSFTHVAMINLDVEGTGQEVYVGPVGGGDDDRIMEFVRKAKDSLKYPYFEGAHYPGSDYESFADAGLENISISVVPGGDGQRLSDMMKSSFRSLEDSTKFPIVLKVMHTPNDSSAHVSPTSLSMSFQFVSAILRFIQQK